MSDIWLIIALAAVLTYGTRTAGYLLVTRLGTIPPRLDAALNAVPAAVLVTIVTPVLVNGEAPERIAIVISLFLALRLPLIATVAIGTALVAAARAVGF